MQQNQWHPMCKHTPAAGFRQLAKLRLRSKPFWLLNPQKMLPFGVREGPATKGTIPDCNESPLVAAVKTRLAGHIGGMKLRRLCAGARRCSVGTANL